MNRIIRALRHCFALGIILGALGFALADRAPASEPPSELEASPEKSALTEGDFDGPQPLFRNPSVSGENLAESTGGRSPGPASFQRFHREIVLAMRDVVGATRLRAARLGFLDVTPKVDRTHSGILFSHSTTSPPFHA